MITFTKSDQTPCFPPVDPLTPLSTTLKNLKNLGASPRHAVETISYVCCAAEIGLLASMMCPQCRVTASRITLLVYSAAFYQLNGGDSCQGQFYNLFNSFCSVKPNSTCRLSCLLHGVLCCCQVASYQSWTPAICLSMRPPHRRRALLQGPQSQCAVLRPTLHTAICHAAFSATCHARRPAAARLAPAAAAGWAPGAARQRRPDSLCWQTVAGPRRRRRRRWRRCQSAGALFAAQRRRPAVAEHIA